MARLIMNRDRCRSDGERMLYDFFQKYFSDELMIWTNVELLHTRKDTDTTEEVEIDFVLHHKEVGVLILEVKDWRIDHIGQISADRITLVSGRNEKNPARSLKNRFYMLKEKCSSRNELCEQRNFLKFGIHYALCLPYISEAEWTKKLSSLHVNPDDVGLPNNSILFQEYFADESPLTNPYRAINKLCNLRRHKIPSHLKETELDYLSTLLGAPDNEESLVQDILQQTSIPLGSEQALIRMDEEQERIAAEYLSKVFANPGHLIIEGVAGSGKTLLLQHVYCQLARIPDIKLAYVGRQRELIDEFRYNLLSRDVNLDDDRFFVGTDYELFRRVIGEEIWKSLGKFRSEGWDKRFIQYIAENKDSIPQLFDYMLIDEGHNFPDQHITMCVRATKAGNNGNVIFMEDPEQNIWDTERSYRMTGLKFDNKVSLLNNYRNTVEISRFALVMSNKYSKVLKESHRLADLRHGPVPTVVYNQDSDACARKIFSKYQEWIQDGFSPDEVAIIYPMSEKDEKGNIDKEGLLQNILRCFGDSGIAFCHRYKQFDLMGTFGQYAQYIVSRPDPSSLEQYEKVRQSCLNLVTSWSSQGLTYRCAIVVMDKFGIGKWSPRVENNLLYITLTRATSDLMVSFHLETDLYRKAIDTIVQMRNP